VAERSAALPVVRPTADPAVGRAAPVSPAVGRAGPVTPAPARPTPGKPPLLTAHNGRRARRLVAGGLTARRSPATVHAVRPLVAAHRTHHPRADASVLHRAYATAERLHRGQLRQSGEPFITHPLAVAMILAHLGTDTTTLVAALLHDTVEDTDYSLGAVTRDFGSEVARLVDGVTKVELAQAGAAAEAETLRKMLLAAGTDPRVLVVKLADRLHNMRTLRFKPRHKQVKTARFTADLLVPLASRLGIHVVKREMEDLVFQTLHPEDFAELAEVVAERDRRRATTLGPVLTRTWEVLRAAHLPADVTDRPRHLASVYDSALRRHRANVGPNSGDSPTRDQPRVADLPVTASSRMLVVVHGDTADCYAALGEVHGAWHPVPGRFKDHVAAPKFNMYQSLHTTVLDDRGEPIEVIVRTDAMHQVAEHGVVADIRAAAARGATSPAELARRVGELEWLQRLLDWQRQADAGEFMTSLRYDFCDQQVTVFGTGGRQVDLPERSTPVDFAYALGEDVGHRLYAARVNGRLVRLSTTLTDGDHVELVTASSEVPGPSESWLSFVRSPQARLRIRRWLARRQHLEAVELGKSAVREMLTVLGDADDLAGGLPAVARRFGHPDLDGLYAAVGRSETTPEAVVRSLVTV
jgi:guanosine-3',5'-bis(diphosphate) 3'-pyrophosphohydrolase